MNKNGIIAILIVLATATGCKLSETYKQPELDLPSNYYGSDTLMNSDEKALSEIQWADFFQDSLLISLIDTALYNNMDMQIADVYVDIGVSKLKQAKANFLPSVTANPLEYRKDMYSENYNNYGSNRSRRNHGDNPPTSLYTERMEYSSSIGFSWELDIWGKLSSQKKAAQFSYMQTKEFQKAVKTSLVTEIASTYYNLLLLKSQLAVYNGNLSLNDSTLTIVKLQYDAGEVTSLAVKQTHSQKLRAQSLIPQLEREYIKLENRLNRLLGGYPQNIEVEMFTSAMLETDYVSGMPLELVSNRPDVAAAEYKLKESYELVGVANAMRYPSISIGATTGLNSFELDKLLNPLGSGFLLLNGVVFQPIFQQRRLKTNYEVALAEKKIAELEFKGKFLIAMNEVSDAMVTLEKLKEEYAIVQERVAAANKAVKDASFLFKSGLANYIEVLAAQGELLDSELNLENVKMQIFVANVELYRSLGGGWR